MFNRTFNKPATFADIGVATGFMDPIGAGIVGTTGIIGTIGIIVIGITGDGAA